MLELELFLTTQTLGIPVAFLAGVISFFAPCVVPLLPAYLSYVAGVSIKELKEKGYKPFYEKLILSSLIYVLGFSLVFVLLGGIAGNLGSALRLHSRKIEIAGGLLMVYFGLELLGIIHSRFIAKERKAKLPKWAQDLGYFKPFLLGIIFAAAWTPCIGPILGAILVLATTGGSPLAGALLLFVYSLGISLPFFVISLTLASAPKHIKSLQTFLIKISRVSGFVLVAIGLALVLGWYAHINSFVLQLVLR